MVSLKCCVFGTIKLANAPSRGLSESGSTMLLTDVICRNAKPTDVPRKKSDGNGLYLDVVRINSKYWRFNYRFDGKQKTYAMGTYPTVSLKEARERLAAAKKLLASGIDPNEQLKQQKFERKLAVSNSFEIVSSEWLSKQKPKWSEDYYKKVEARLSKNVWPWLGKRPVSEIKAMDVLEVLRKIEARKAHDMAGRVRETIGKVMCYAVATGRAEFDPTPSLKGALTVHVKKHMPSITDPKRVGEVMRAFDAFSGTHTVRCALLLGPLLFCRPGELRKMKWAHLNLADAQWNLPVELMKMRKEHLVPLSRQAIALIEEMRPLSSHLEYVFPGARDPKRPMSNGAVNAALRSLGIDTKEELTGHGFRAMARTIIHEKLGFDPDCIEAELSHTKKGTLGSAYDRTTFIDQRTEMMQVWADYLDELKKGGQLATSSTVE